MIIGYARVSTTEQNLGLRHDDVKPAFDASVDHTEARKATVQCFGRSDRRALRQYDGIRLCSVARLSDGAEMPARQGGMDLAGWTCDVHPWV
jgi:hypothetical protein